MTDGIDRKWRDWVAALVLALAFVITCRHFLWPVGQPDLALMGDFVRQFYPWRHYAGAELFAGRLPLWDPLTGCGVDFVARLETAVFYPPHLALPWLTGGDLSYYAGQLLVLAHLPLYGLTLYILLRGLGAARSAALFGGLCGLADSFLRAWLEAPTNPQAVVWLPLVILYLWRVVRQPGARPAVLGGAALGVSLLGGMTQLTLYAGFGFLVMWLVWCPPRWREPGYPRLLSLGWSAAIPALAAALAMVQILPTLGLTLDSPRLANDAAFSLGRGLPWTWVAGRALAPNDFLGALPAGLALVALLGRGGRMAWGLAVAGLWAALFALGPQGPVAPLMVKYLPGFGLFREPERVIFLVFLVEHVLAGLGLDWLMRPVERPLAWWRRGLPVLGLGAAAALALIHDLGVWSLWSWLPLAAWVALSDGWLPAAWQAQAGRGLAGVAFIITLLAGNGPHYSAPFPAEGFYAETPRVAWLQKRLAQDPPFRVGGQGYLASYPGWEKDPGTWPRVACAPLVHGIPTIDIAGQLADRRLWEMYALTGPNPRIYDLMNTLYEATPPAAPPPRGAKYAPPDLSEGGRVLYDLGGLMPSPVKRLALVSQMAFARQVPQGATVAEIVLRDAQGDEVRLPVRAGLETAEWAVDKPGEAMAHQAASLARSWAVQGEGYMGHAYLALLDLPRPIKPVRVELVRRGPGVLKVEDLRLGGKSLYHLGTRWRLAKRGLFRNRWALPRAFVVEEVLAAPDEARAKELLRTLEPSLQAVAQGVLPPPAPGLAADGASPGVRVLESAPDRVRIEAALERPGLLVLTDTLAPGWRAYDGDQRLEMVRADLLFRGVHLGAGKHLVEMRYANPWFQAGAVLSILALAACSGLWWIVRRKERQRSED